MNKQLLSTFFVLLVVAAPVIAGFDLHIMQTSDGFYVGLDETSKLIAAEMNRGFRKRLPREISETKLKQPEGLSVSSVKLKAKDNKKK